MLEDERDETDVVLVPVEYQNRGYVWCTMSNKDSTHSREYDNRGMEVLSSCKMYNVTGVDVQEIWTNTTKPEEVFNETISTYICTQFPY